MRGWACARLCNLLSNQKAISSTKAQRAHSLRHETKWRHPTAASRNNRDRQSQQTSKDKVPAGWEIILEKVCADSLKSQDPKSLDTNRRIWKVSQNQKQSTNPLEKGGRAKSGYRKSAETTVPVQKPSATFLASRAPHHASFLANFMLIQSHDQVLKHRTHERGTL